MTRQEFIDILSLYEGVEVYVIESNKWVSITLSKYTDCWGGASPEIRFNWDERSIDITGINGLEPKALLQLSYVLKLVYEYLQKGTWK